MTLETVKITLIRWAASCNNDNHFKVLELATDSLLLQRYKESVPKEEIEQAELEIHSAIISRLRTLKEQASMN